MAKDANIESVAGESTTTTTGNSVDETTLKGTFKYEEPVQISATLKTEQGYTITFKEWQSTSTAILQADEDKKSAQTNFTMPAEDVTVTATSNREANTVGYRVEYYYEGENGYAETPTYTDETRTAKVATTVSVTNADKVADERNPGFRFDENADNVLTTTIPTSGTAVLKVYFKKAIFTLKVVAGDKVTEIKLGEDTAGEGETLQGTYMYGTSITIDATVGTQEGYEITFEKWKSSDTTLMADNTTKNLTFTMPDGDITLTAIASVTPLDASYTVEYYYQANGEYPENPGEGNVVTRTGKTGQQVSITNADKEPITSGYVYDTNADNIETTDVNGLKPDGSTTLKVHFKEQFTVKYLPGDHANFEGTTIRNLDYNSEIPGYTGSTEGKDGFIFDSWKLTKIGETEVTDGTEIPTTVKANLEYTAQWKAMPTPEVTHAPTTWTNQNVTVTITAPESFEDYDIEYKIDDNPEWNTYNEPFEVEQNCVIHARLGKDDNKGEAVDHPVTNIDKVNPEFANTPTFTINNNTALVKANVTDNLSGVVEYGMRKDIYTGFTKHTCANTLSAELTFDDAHESGTYELYIKDAAGNTNTTTVEVVIPVHNVAKIVSAPAGFESLIGTEYTSLTEALSTSDEAAQAGNVKIEIIDYIDNEENTILNGRDYTINLNNYTVKNQEGKTAMTVSGKLRLVDENALGEGTLSSPFGLGVYITLDGELTLGKDGDGTPGIFSPIVEGGSYGIKKEINYNAEQVYDENKDAYYYPEGVLNFYDGKVIGGTAAFMIQRVNDTPSMYDPTVVTNQNTGNQESTLAIVSGVEAVIGKKRYMLLEDAVADANNVIGDSNTQVEITVVKDISKDANHKVVVDETKNIKLNTNGYSITTTTNDYVIKNYGKLEVYDSNADKNGTVCTKLADDVDIVTGERTTWDGRYVINNGKDFSFTFDIAATQKYKMAVTARYLNRGSAVYLDGTEIYNFVNSGAGNDWTTFNLDLGVISEGEHTIRIYSTGSTPYYEKFEIKGNEPVGKIVGSSASTIYNGISDAAKEDIEYENVDLTQAVANGTYYFETRAEGGLISNNGGVASTALSYIVLDLTDKTGMYEVVVDSLISSRANNDYGYVTVSYDSALKPDANYTYGRKIYKSGNGIDERDKFNLAGGEKYYINFGYRKSANSASYSDCFIIKNIKVGKIEKAGTLTITSGNYQNTAPNKTYYEVFDNDGLMYVNGGTIRTDNYYLEGIVNGKNSNSGYLEVNGGNIYTHYGRNIVNQGLALAKLNKGSFGKATNTYQNSYDEILYNNCGALYTLTDDVVLNGVTGIETVNSGKSVLDKGKINAPYQNGVVTGANGRSYVNNVTINASSYGIYSNSDSAVTYINGANIIKASTGIYNYYNGRIEIDNVTMTTTDGSGTPTIQYGIYNNSSGKIIVNNADVYSKNHAIYNYINGTIEINDGTYRTQSSSYATAINANYNNNSSATLIVRGGTITGPTNAIYNLNNGRVTVTGGFLESTGSNAIASVGTGSVTIGSNDGEVSKTTPVVKSHAYGAVYNARGTFNYYDGVLVGLEDTVIRGILSDMPENYELVREIKEDNLQYITLGIPTNYVAKIAAIDNPDVSVLDSSYYKLENGYYYFITLKAAVDACSKTNASQIDLLSAVSVYRKITVDSQHDITIKTNGNKIYMNCAVDFENNGKLKIEGVPKEDGDTTKEIISYGGMLFKNNEGAQLDLDSCSISDSSEQGVSSNYRKIFDNFGTLNISNMIVRVYYGSKNTHMYAYSIYNEQSGNINLTNVELTGNAQYPIYNYGADKTDENEVVTYSAVMTNCKYTYENGGRPYGPQNMGTGTFLIDGCTIDNWGSSYSTDNYSTGTIIMRNSTNNGYMYNRSSGYVEIDNTEVKDITYNQSTGKILVKGELSKLSRMDNNNASGTIEIQAGTVKYSSSSPTINNSGKLIVSGGTISNTYNYSQSYGINNTSSAVATIYGSNTIITSNYVSGINNTGTLTLGVEGDGVDSRPIVKGKTYGVYSTGTFNFFDGIIEGATATSIGGRVTRTEEGYLRVIYGSEEIYDDGTEDKYTVPANKEISVLEHIEIAYVESTGRTYTTLKAALADTAATDTIKLINDVTLSANTESLTIPEGKNITFDLNGKNIQAGNARLFINNGTFKIKDSTSHIEDDELIEGSIVSGNNIILENNGIASVDNGTYRLTVGGSSSEYKSIFENNGTLTITGGTTKLESQYCIAIRNNENATVTMNNMSITLNVNYGYGIYNNKGTATMKSGSITNNASYCYSAYNANTGDITIEGGTIDKSNGVYNASTGTCTIKDGATINAQVYNYSTGTIDILGGTITHGDNAVYNSNSGTINIKKGTITGSGNTIYNTSSGTININGEALSADAPIRIIGRNNNDANAVTNYGSGTINITGFVEIESTSGNTSYTERGIYNNTNNGTINIGKVGELDNRVKVTSTNHAVVNWGSGTLNYYGGVLTAPTAVYGYITRTSDVYEIVRSIDENNREVYVVGELEDAISIGNDTYSNIADALAEHTTGTIVVEKNIVIANDKVFTITNQHNIELDMNGHIARIHTNGAPIVNEGTLKFNDKTAEASGKLSGYSTLAIQNKGNFEMANGEIYIVQKSGSKIITNEDRGNINITGGTIYVRGTTYNTDRYYGIYATGGNSITMSGGSIKLYSLYYSGWWSSSTSYAYGIYATVPIEDVTVTGGSFTNENDRTTYAIYLDKGGDVILSGNTSMTTHYGVYANSNNTTNVTVKDNVNITASDSIVLYSSATGTVDIKGGTMKNISVGNYATVNMKGGFCNSISGGTSSTPTSTLNVYEGTTINNGTNVAIKGFSIVNIYGSAITGGVQEPSKEFNMTGGSITGGSYGLRLNNSNVKAVITGGTITATSGPGIQVASGTLTLGVNGENEYPDTAIPAITGSTYGVENSGGTFNFYDGILTGNTYATNGTVTDTPEMFTVIYSDSGRIGILGIEATFEQVATVNGIYYNDLTGAVNAAINVNGRVELCKDITTSTNITIPADASITIDLYGFSINGYTQSGALITNNGTLVIEDTTDEGVNESTIRNYTGVAIVNNGNLVTGTNDGTVYTSAPIITGTTVALVNHGTWDFVDGKITRSEESGDIITNDGTARKPQGYSVVRTDNVYTLVAE